MTRRKCPNCNKGILFLETLNRSMNDLSGEKFWRCNKGCHYIYPRDYFDWAGKIKGIKNVGNKLRENDLGDIFDSDLEIQNEETR